MLRGAYYGLECYVKTSSTLPRKEKECRNREQSLKQHALETVIWREFAAADGNTKRHLSTIFNNKSPYWRVQYAWCDRDEQHEHETLKTTKERDMDSHGEREKTIAEHRTASGMKTSARRR